MVFAIIAGTLDTLVLSVETKRVRVVTKEK